MLYTRIRYARQIRSLSSLRHVLARDRHPSLGHRMGYKKYSRSYYLLNQRLHDARVLDYHGKFIESITNDWVAEMPLHAKPEEMRALGFKPAFDLYLALVIAGDLTAKYLARWLDSCSKSVYLGIRKLADLSLIRTGKSVQANKESPVFGWLERYLRYALVQADMTRSSAPLFSCVPGYIDGPTGYLATHYKPGLTLHPRDMEIRTSPIFEPFWKLALEKVDHLASYPIKIHIMPASDDAELEWIDLVPYNKKSWWYV